MPNQPTRLIAIDPGTRALGYAEFDGPKLVDCGIKIIRRGLSLGLTLGAIEEIIEKLIREKRPHVMVIEKNNFSAIQQNARLVMATSRMKAVARRSRVPVHEIAASTARKTVCGNGFATKRDVAKILRSRFPELSIYIDPLNRHRQKLFLNLFDAVACGMASLKEHARNES